MPARADDDMVVDRYFKVPPRLHDFAGELDVLTAGGGVAARVVVNDENRGRGQLERAADDFADINLSLIHI